MSYTEINFENFGYREIAMTARLLSEYADNPRDIESPIKIGFNANSGNVFIIDYNENVFLMHYDEYGGGLEQFFSCGECGLEGFKEEFDKNSKCEGCRDIATREYTN